MFELNRCNHCLMDDYGRCFDGVSNATNLAFAIADQSRPKSGRGSPSHVANELSPRTPKILPKDESGGAGLKDAL